MSKPTNLNAIAPSTTITLACDLCGKTWPQVVELPRCRHSCGGQARHVLTRDDEAGERTRAMLDNPEAYAAFHQDVADQILAQQRGPGWYWDKRTRSVRYLEERER